MSERTLQDVVNECYEANLMQLATLRRSGASMRTIAAIRQFNHENVFPHVSPAYIATLRDRLIEISEAEPAPAADPQILIDLSLIHI